MEDKGQLTKTPFSIIEGSDILTKEDVTALSELGDELKETFLKVQVFRTRTEMEVSVLNDLKFPTHASKYWQATREQDLHFHELVMLSYEYRKNLVGIRKLERDLDAEEDDLEKELKRIEIEKQTFIARNQERVAKDRIREIQEWSAIKAREAKEMTKEELSDVGVHQLKSYTERFMGEAAVAGTQGSPSENINLAGKLVTAVRHAQDKGILSNIKNANLLE